MTNDELRRLAEAATPGPWCNVKDTVFHGEIRQANDEGFALIAVMPELDDREADFDYIAAASPDAVLALLDERDRLAELLKRCEWSGADYLGKDACPICERGVWYYGKEHAPDCELAQALRGESGRDPLATMPRAARKRGGMKRLVIRTIRNGRVKINGRVFVPDQRYMAYDGRLDGMRYAFGLYATSEILKPFVSLWGSEKEFRGDKNTERPEIVDGALPWVFWFEQKEVELPKARS
jgi:hypothetical protein